MSDELIPTEAELLADHDVTLDEPIVEIGKYKAPRTAKLQRFSKNSTRYAGQSKGARRRYAWEKAFAKVITRGKFEKVVEAMLRVAQNDEHPSQVIAQKAILDRCLGKARQTIDINEHSTLTIEEKRTRVLTLLGVLPEDATLKFADGSLAFEDQQNDLGQSALALPIEVPAGHQPVLGVGEVPPGGGDVGVGTEVGAEAGDAQQEDGPPVQFEGRTDGQGISPVLPSVGGEV
jgi:hypothetical protein